MQKQHHWIPHFPREHLASDLIAGLVVAILVIPQSLAYALLAGLPPQAGLYISIFPVMAYAFLGSSRVQAVGPVAITAIMTFSVINPLAAPGSPEYITIAATLALLSGLLMLGFGLLRLGFLSQILSRPVVSGFISGSAVLIIVSQIPSLLGIRIGEATAWHLILALAENVKNASTVTLQIGMVSLVVLYASRRWLGTGLIRIGVPPRPAELAVRLMPLAVIGVATGLVVTFDLDRTHGVAVVGSFQEGLPGFKLFLPSLASVKSLAFPALILAFIGTVQGISMAQALAAKRRERVNANRELIGLGASNVVAAFYGGMPVGGGLSRTAVNVAAGAQSQLASLVTALTMLVIVVAGTHLFTRLPLAALAANIVVAAMTMIDIPALRQAWSYDRADALALLGTGIGVIVFGLQPGIVLGIGLSLAALLVRASTPHIAVIGRIPGTEHFRNVERHEVETIPGALLLRIDENLFFGNLSAIEARLTAELDKTPSIRDIVLIMSSVNRVDTTAMEVLTDVNRELLSQNIHLHLAEVKGPVQDRLAKSPFWKALSGKVYLSVNDAFQAIAQKNKDR